MGETLEGVVHPPGGEVVELRLELLAIGLLVHQVRHASQLGCRGISALVGGVLEHGPVGLVFHLLAQVIEVIVLRTAASWS
jgi:hypothetical protein